VDTKRALETQRLRLLRLLAGLLIAVAFASVAPIAPAWSRRVRAFVVSVLQRAELAAQNLVFVQACVMAAERGVGYSPSCVGSQFVVRPFDDDALPTLNELRQRLNALSRLLDVLPRHAERMLRRMKRSLDSGATSLIWFRAARDVPVGAVHGANQWHALEFWHPPRFTQRSYDS